MKTDIWIAEYRVMGWRSALVPPMIMAAFVAVSWLTHAVGDSSDATTILTAGLELGLPLTAAGLAAVAAGHDPGRELQLSLPTPYRLTVTRRIALIAAWAVALAMLLAAGLIGTGRWTAPAGTIGGQLSWGATLAWLVVVACTITVWTRSHAGAVAVIATLAVAEAAFGDLFVSTSWLHPFYLLATTKQAAHAFWWDNRLWLLGTALVASLVTWLLLGHPERLLTEDEA